MPQEDEVFFSVIIPLDKSPHLIRHTLRSIFSQTFSFYEIIVVAKRSDHHLLDILGDSQSQVKLIRAKTDNRAEMMNRGVKKAKGKYLHFLFPGDTYLFPNCLLEIHALLEGKDLDLFHSAYLKREEKISYAVSQNFSLYWLKKGKLPTKLQACFFLKSSLVKYGLFNQRYHTMTGLDLIMNFFMDKNARNFFIKKVFCDFELKKTSPKEMLSEIAETFWLIKTHFGLLSACRWWLFQDQVRIYHWMKRMLKKAFYKA